MPPGVRYSRVHRKRIEFGVGQHGFPPCCIASEYANLLLGRHDLHLLALAVKIVEPQRAESTNGVHAAGKVLGDALKPLARLDLAFGPVLFDVTGDRDGDLELVGVRVR